MSRRRGRWYVGEKGKDPLKDYNAPSLDISYEANQIRTEYWIAKQIGTALVKKYPNREWSVDVDTKNEVIVICCPALTKRMGYRVHMKRDNVAKLIPRCIRAAGEILERYGVSRSPIIDPRTMESYDRYLWDDVKNPMTEREASRV